LHGNKLGAVATFNLAFEDVEEQFVSILEDDNWWEPDFLRTMLDAMERNPQVNVAWANMWYRSSRKMARGDAKGRFGRWGEVIRARCLSLRTRSKCVDASIHRAQCW